MEEVERRALGALLGLFVGDAFGAQTEFITEERLVQAHPNGLLEMDERERCIGVSGMITDDSEMAIMLAKSMIKQGTVDSEDIRSGYMRWLDALPSDIGTTILTALREGVLNPDSQANGALMRVAPIGVAGATLSEEAIIAFSDSDCAITHIHPVCRDANRLWALAIAKVVREGLSAPQVYEYLLSIAPQVTEEEILLDTIREARSKAPASCDGRGQGWVILALHLSLHTLLHASGIEEGIIQITMRGGDADTNAAIYGALAGAVFGADAIPIRWIEALRPTRCLEDLLGAEAADLAALAHTLSTGLVRLGTI
ncbi:MAG: ADP-ribosylglycohydrolase family protein [Sphaerochaeta sp.]|nr:ADP-ribosylglycohydrolase family protein [Sphaerochaeta sp.]